MEDKVEEIYRKFSTLEEDIKNSKKQINIRFIILSILFMLFAIYLTYEAFSYKDKAEYLLHMGLGMCILLYFQRVYSIRELNSKYKQSVVPELLSLINSNLTYTTQAGHTEDEFKKAEVYDDRIDKFAIGRSTKRMPKADLAILRVAVSEMLYYDTPDSVVINEAVEMAKKYCSAESAGFINGVLGSIQRNL